MAKALQTKLTREQKDILKDFIAEAKAKGIEVYQDEGYNNATIALEPCLCNSMPKSDFVKMAITYKGATETKFRKKAALYTVLGRLLNAGEYVVLEKYDAYEFVYSILGFDEEQNRVI